MCGICGVLNLDSRRPADRTRVAAMCEALRHRGPDEEGSHVDGEVALGIRRLKVIDLDTGSQPLHNEDRTVWVVFNGEIYNFRALRKELESKGHEFHTRTDGETIVHLYEEHGEECMTRLRGMFAFAVWDSRRRRLMLVRDRVGVKQLYYSYSEDALAFGSEIKCLLQGPSRGGSIDLRALHDFLVYRYVAGERTIFESIKRLPPAHRLVHENGSSRVERYWKLDPRPRETADEAEVVGEFRRRFEEAVRIRMISDVPLGAFLSGGIDSSAVVGIMAQSSTEPVKTFTIGYEAEGVYYDERRYARLVAERFGTDHHELVVRPQVEDVMPKIIRAFDEPFGDSSVIPNWFVSKHTREHVTVALSGLGGDEVAAGYERYLGGVLSERVRRVPGHGTLGRWIQRLPDSRDGSLAVDRVKRFFAGLEYDFPERYRRYVSTFTREEVSALLAPDLRERARGEPYEDPLEVAGRDLVGYDVLSRMTFLDIRTYLPDDLLVLADRLSMAHSLEARVPFVDHELLEFVATIPSRIKLRGTEKKHLLRAAFKDLLPPEILRRKKIGFSIPLAVWFRGSLRSYLMDWLGEARMARLGYFDVAAVSRLIAEHVSRRHNHENKLWVLLMFSLWHDAYVEKRAG